MAIVEPGVVITPIFAKAKRFADPASPYFEHVRRLLAIYQKQMPFAAQSSEVAADAEAPLARGGRRKAARRRTSALDRRRVHRGRRAHVDRGVSRAGAADIRLQLEVNAGASQIPLADRVLSQRHTGCRPAVLCPSQRTSFASRSSIVGLLRGLHLQNATRPRQPTGWTSRSAPLLLRSNQASNPCFMSAARFRNEREKLAAVDYTPVPPGLKCARDLRPPRRSESQSSPQPRPELRGLGTSWEPEREFPGKLGIGPTFPAARVSAAPLRGCDSGVFRGILRRLLNTPTMRDSRRGRGRRRLELHASQGRKARSPPAPPPIAGRAPRHRRLMREPRQAFARRPLEGASHAAAAPS